MLTKDQILKHRPLPHVDVECKGFGGIVRIKAMSAATRDISEQRMANLEEIEKGVQPNIRAMFLVHCIVDEKGVLMFDVDDIELLSSQSIEDIGLLFKEGQRINGLLDDEEEVKKK